MMCYHVSQGVCRVFILKAPGSSPLLVTVVPLAAMVTCQCAVARALVTAAAEPRTPVRFPQTVNEEDFERDRAERRRVQDHSTTGSGPRLDIAHRPRTDAPEAKMGTLHRSTCTARHERHDGARSTRQMARVGPAAQLR